jgi:hypothetical protein
VRDVGILIWVGLLVIGVVGSMISSMRRQRQAQANGRVPPRRPVPPIGPSQTTPLQAVTPGTLRWVDRSAVTPSGGPRFAPQAAPAAAREVRKPSPVMHVPVPPRPAADHQRTHQGLIARRRLFGSKREIVRAVIAAEVLGKPRALRDE